MKKIIFAGLLLICLPLMAEEKPYDIRDGKVDKGTYNGFRRFHSTCHVCHGKDALGSTIAPNLTESLKKLSYEEFKDTVTNGRVSQTAGKTNVMPPFKDNKDVMRYLDDLYAFLKARSDGVLGRGRPTRWK